MILWKKLPNSKFVWESNGKFGMILLIIKKKKKTGVIPSGMAELASNID